MTPLLSPIFRLSSTVRHDQAHKLCGSETAQRALEAFALAESGNVRISPHDARRP